MFDTGQLLALRIGNGFRSCSAKFCEACMCAPSQARHTHTYTHTNTHFHELTFFAASCVRLSLFHGTTRRSCPTKSALWLVTRVGTWWTSLRHPIFWNIASVYRRTYFNVSFTSACHNHARDNSSFFYSLANQILGIVFNGLEFPLNMVFSCGFL